VADAFRERKVHCRFCRFRFTVQVPFTEGDGPADDWRAEAQCPACEHWACFTVDDTPERQRSGPSPESLRLLEDWHAVTSQMFALADRHQSHPVVATLEKIGNGVFEDDYGPTAWPIPWMIYRFRRDDEVAYVWQEDECWLVRAWHPLRGGGEPPSVQEVASFAAALDWLQR
jgi:hypothetical protein